MSDAGGRVAVLVDCENLEPEAAEHALRVVVQFGPVVLRRASGFNRTGSEGHGARHFNVSERCPARPTA
jgi:hypothetical protein